MLPEGRFPETLLDRRHRTKRAVSGEPDEADRLCRLLERLPGIIVASAPAPRGDRGVPDLSVR